jgi:hypothetical protein
LNTCYYHYSDDDWGGDSDGSSQPSDVPLRAGDGTVVGLGIVQILDSGNGNTMTSYTNTNWAINRCGKDGIMEEAGSKTLCRQLHRALTP